MIIRICNVEFTLLTLTDFLETWRDYLQHAGPDVLGLLDYHDSPDRDEQHRPQVLHESCAVGGSRIPQSDLWMGCVLYGECGLRNSGGHRYECRLLGAVVLSHWSANRLEFCRLRFPDDHALLLVPS